MSAQPLGQEAPRAPAPPSISLPKGGGAIRGIGEKFATNPATGTSTLTIPIATSPGRSGFGPDLALSYDSGAGSGTFGFGWSLSLPVITRKTDKGLPRYRDDEESDVFVLSGAEDLVPALSKTSGGGWVTEVLSPRVVDGHTYDVRRYVPRVEGQFARIERWTNRDEQDDCFWRSISQDNVTTWYGRTPESRVADPDDPRRIFSWLICETHDDQGHVAAYRYKREDSASVDTACAHERNRSAPSRSANRHLKRILYGNHKPYLPTLLPTQPWPAPPGSTAADASAHWFFEVVLDYGEHDPSAPTPADAGAWTARADPFSSYRAGFEVRTYRRCRRVLMFHHFDGEPGVGRNCLVRSVELDYAEDAGARHSLLARVSQSGYKRSGTGYRKRSLPPVELTYSRAEIDETVHDVDPASLANLPSGVDGVLRRWADLDGEGLTGVLSEDAGGWRFRRNVSTSAARLGPAELLAAVPVPAALGGDRQLIDLAGDGRLDVAVFGGPLTGFFERTAAGGWETFTPFSSLPNIDWNDPNLRFVDLTGDGRPDVLVTEHDVLRWYPSQGEAGFGDGEQLPWAADDERRARLVFADGTQSLYLADMSGDGLSDLVRIENGAVCYWPSLGYGRFGGKLTMDAAPRFDDPGSFEQQRLRLADIDGSGTVDLLYLGRDGVEIFLNRSGNSWGPARTLAGFPRIDDLASVTAVDLLGDGTACLVWSSALPVQAGRAMRYVSLMGGQKPHLLIRVVNNLGLETELRYVPSTRFFLADKLAGRPWTSKLPFPVHVVERVCVRDAWRNTEFATTYSYHHGCFDGAEREFRGFGRVEQIDVETFDTFAAANAGSPFVTDDLTLYEPPVKSVSWFHTGAGSGSDGFLSQYSDEYFPLPEHALPEPELATDELLTAERREALRACKGMMLRQERYELDVDALHERGEHVPVRLFSTAQHNCSVRRLQPRADNRHAVFHVTASEALTYRYELDLRQRPLAPDPRIAHTLNLTIDEYGHVLEAVTVVYGRSGSHQDPQLDPKQLALIRKVQGEAHLSYTETRFTNDVPKVAADRDNHRIRAPYDARSYELTGMAGSGPRGFFTLEGLRASLPGAQAVDYDVLPSGTLAQKRLIEHTRTLYLRDDLQGPLALGEQGRLGLIHETYALALTDTLLASVFGARLSDTVDGTATAQQKLDDETVSGYLSGADLSSRFSPRVPAAELAGQYWKRSGTAGFASDAPQHFYLPVRHIDAFGAVTTIAFDARDLFVERSTDAVGNTSSLAAFDYRVLAARAHRDVNDNVREVAFDALGMVVASAVRGKGTEGDSLAGLTDGLADPAPSATAAFLAAPALDAAKARQWLGDASTRFVYHLGESRDAAGNVVAWAARPATSCTIQRETHLAAPGGSATALQVSLECSDGAGQVLMTKRQAEPKTTGGPLRWLVSALTVVNNKGKPVKQYEPYFSGAFGWEVVQAAGVTPVMYYDAAGRLIRTESADGTISRVDFSPWQVTAHDPNDTVLDPGNAWYVRNSSPAATAEQRRAAGFAAGHAYSPSVTILDSLGRDVIAIAHNRYLDGAGTQHDERSFSYTKLDAEGNPLWMRDPRGNLPVQYIRPAMPALQRTDATSGYVPCYDLAGSLLYENTMDGGERWTLTDAAGHPLAAWTSNQRQDDSGTVVDEDRVAFSEYDVAQRPTRQWLTINGGQARVVEHFIYGESLPEADAKARNLRAQQYRHYEASGRLQNDRFDFKGNQRQVSRRLTRDYRASVVDWQTSPEANLETETFVQINEHDALNRVVRVYTWHRGSGSRVAVVEPAYDERGGLRSEALVLRATKTAGGYTPNPAYPRRSVISEIRYDEKGQPELVRYGNDTVTRYDHDPQSFRLRQLRTTRPNYDPAFPNEAGALSDPRVLQNLSFTYDAFGNVSATRDDAFEPVFFRNQQVEAASRYVYDGLYRLIEASGRESAQGPRPAASEAVAFDVQFPVTNQTLRNYTERYTYDATGNIIETAHRAAGGNWVRHYGYAAEGNRLAATWYADDIPGATRYAHDRHGNMLNLVNGPPTSQIRWDYRDLVRALDRGGGGWAHYNYHSGNRRSRQVISATATGGRRWERIHLDGLEIYRRYAGGAIVEEIESLHVFHGDRRVLLVDDVLQTDSASLSTGPLLRFQYGDQVHSTTLEADEAARIISYEELHPHGSSAYRSRNASIEAPPRRYRHTGMHRDAESGLDYHGARYYAPWLGRWLSCDPAGLADGPNRYAYCRGSPITNADPEGTQTSPFGASGVYRLLETDPGVSTREHLLGGAQMRELLNQGFGKNIIDPLWDRLYKNSNATMLLNTVAGPKTLGAPKTATAPRILGDTPLWRLMNKDTTAGRTSDTRSWYLQNRQNFAGALLHGGFTPDAATMERFDKGAVAQSRALFVGEQMAQAAVAGKTVPKELAGLVNPKTPPNPVPPAKGTGVIPVMKFTKPPSAQAAPVVVPPPVDPDPIVPASGLKNVSGGSGWKGVAGGVAVSGAALGLPMIAGAVAQAPFESQKAKSAASTLASGLTSVGVEWVGLVGPTMAIAGASATASTVAAGATTAFTATGMGGIAAGGAAAVGVAGVAVAAAGAVGYGVGTVLNKAIVEPLVDKAAPGSGALGDWWYRKVLK